MLKSEEFWIYTYGDNSKYAQNKTELTPRVSLYLNTFQCDYDINKSCDAYRVSNTKKMDDYERKNEFETYLINKFYYMQTLNDDQIITIINQDKLTLLVIHLAGLIARNMHEKREHDIKMYNLSLSVKDREYAEKVKAIQTIKQNIQIEKHKSVSWF